MKGVERVPLKRYPGIYLARSFRQIIPFSDATSNSNSTMNESWSRAFFRHLK